MTIVAFEDIESLIIAYLKAALTAHNATATVATRIPNPRPTRLVRVTRKGGTAEYPATDKPRVVVECWDADPVSASELARMARALLWALPADETHGRPVRKVVEVGGPANFPDPLTSLPRYQFSVELHVKGHALEDA